jgi:predicted Zn-dependent protease
LAGCLAGVVVGGLLLWPSSENPDRNSALQAAELGHFADVEPRLRRLHERQPDDSAVTKALALGYLAARRFGDAELYLNLWCELKSGDVEPFERRAELWLQQQNTARATLDIQSVLQIQPDDVRGRQILAQLLFLDAHFAEAEQEALRCLAAQPNNKEVIYLLASIYRRQGQPGKALEQLEHLLRLGPNSGPGLALRAELYLDANQIEPAIDLLVKAKDASKLDLSFGLYPIDRQWINVAGLLSSVQERQLRLYQDTQRAPSPQVFAEQKLDHSIILYLLSQALARAGRDPEAKKVVGEMQLYRALAVWAADKLRDVNEGLQREVVDAFVAAGKPDEAVRFLGDILGRQPEGKGTRRLLAECYEKQGKTDLAAEQRRLSGQGP